MKKELYFFGGLCDVEIKSKDKILGMNVRYVCTTGGNDDLCNEEEINIYEHLETGEFYGY
jgi:hypothetical protein